MSSSLDERTAPAVGTPITTVEEMTALPADTVLDLHHNGTVDKWRRVDSGWVCIDRNGTPVPVTGVDLAVGERFFSGAMADSNLRVSTMAAPRFGIGMVLAVGDYTYVVHSIDGDGRAAVAAFRDRGFIGWDEVNPQFLTRHDVVESTLEARVRPLWVPSMVTAFAAERARVARNTATMEQNVRDAERDGVALREQVRQLNHELVTLRATHGTIPTALRDALHGYASEAEDSLFDDLLNENGLSRQGSVTVNVTITGSHYVTIPRRAAAVELGLAEGEITDVDESSHVTWRIRRQVERTVNVGDCGCEEVSDGDDDVANLVPADVDGWEIEATSCQND